ncbi:unnamed protein product [Discosporangium mesarthrocarpum]
MLTSNTPRDPLDKRRVGSEDNHHRVGSVKRCRPTYVSRQHPVGVAYRRGALCGLAATILLAHWPATSLAFMTSSPQSMGAGKLVEPWRSSRVGLVGSTDFRRLRNRRPSATSLAVRMVEYNERGVEKDPFDEANMLPKAGHVINWYPGHIAKAERKLQDYLKMVDVVIEVRDSRIPQATTHQLVPKWVGKRPLIVVFNRVDSVPACAVAEWKRYLVKEGGIRQGDQTGNIPVFFVDSKRGRGIHEIKKAAVKAGARVNARRVKRGMNPRSVRVAVIGFPNVGKSALINKLVGKRVAKSMNIPGVTRKLNWVRVGGRDTKPEQELELLDSPGIIPAKHDDQQQALKLAICNDIGQASYDRQVVAAQMLDQLVEAAVQFPGYVNLDVVTKRYGIDPRRHTGEEYLLLLAKKTYFGEKNSAADKMLGDFRKGYLGALTLEAPPTPNASHNRLPKKPPGEAAAGDAAGERAVQEGDDFAALAKNNREFVGTGDFEGW